MTDKQRTNAQNRALHLWCKMLSKLLNDSGMDMRTFLKEEIDIPWDEDGRMVKEHIWKPLQEVMLDIESTADAETPDYNKVYEVLVRHLADKKGLVAPPWPSHTREDLR